MTGKLQFKDFLLMVSVLDAGGLKNTRPGGEGNDELPVELADGGGDVGRGFPKGRLTYTCKEHARKTGGEEKGGPDGLCSGHSSTAGG